MWKVVDKMEDRSNNCKNNSIQSQTSDRFLNPKRHQSKVSFAVATFLNLIRNYPQQDNKHATRTSKSFKLAIS